jgi:hypothetical protein
MGHSAHPDDPRAWAHHYSNGELMRSVALSVVLAMVLCLAFAAPAAANHRPRQHCTEDLCAGTFRTEDGIRKFRVVTFAFDAYTLCVWHVDKAKNCHRFEMEDAGEGVYRDTIRWLRHYPDQGPGKYKFVYRVSGNRVTPILGFHE